ncbi:MAG: hypothetical protein LBC51_08975 [Treponema sp.]|nr:hypothetical protein [Treponema sp.]
MMKNNQHTQAIPSTVLTQAKAKVAEAMALLTSYVLALTPEERRMLPKMGEKTIGFVEKAFDFARQNAALVPPLAPETGSWRSSPNSPVQAVPA